MSPAAVFVTVGLISLHNRDEQGNKKAEQAQPGEEDIKKSQDQICKGKDPQVVIPFLLLLHCPITSIEIMLAGHSFAHFPHPMHRVSSTFA